MRTKGANKQIISRAEVEEIDRIRNNIKHWIKEKGYPSIEKFCHSNNLSRSAITDFLNGRSNPTFLTLLRIKAALGVKTVDLLVKDKRKREQVKT